MPLGTYGPEFVRLAWRCAATFRASDYQGGCNGARIRMSPQKDWAVNAGLDKVLDLLTSVKNEYGDKLSWADLIVLAGTVALEEAGAPKMDFCPGRVDADITQEDPISDKLGFMNMEAVILGEQQATIDDLEQWTLLMGLTTAEFTALMGATGLGQIPQKYGGGVRTSNPTVLSTEYYNNLLTKKWMSDGPAYTANGKTILKPDILLTAAPEYLAVVQNFASSSDEYLATLKRAWTKVMNADRFDGPTRNVCRKKSDDQPQVASLYVEEPEPVLVVESASRLLLLIIAALAVSLALAFGVIVFLLRARRKPSYSELRQPLAVSGISHNI